jgi:hypothetical protein
MIPLEARDRTAWKMLREMMNQDGFYPSKWEDGKNAAAGQPTRTRFTWVMTDLGKQYLELQMQGRPFAPDAL